MRGADSDPTEVEEFLHDFSGVLAFDVGGNVGRTATILSDRFDRVVSFEPCAESFSELRTAVADLSNVEVASVAVSDHDGEVELDVQEHPIRSGQLTTGGHAGWGRVIGHRRVECRSLDSLAAEYGVPDLVKIDVEAHELYVVRGGLRTLLDHVPQLYIEVHDAEVGREIRDLLAPVYGSHFYEIAHPHYQPGDWGYLNHYWFIAEGET